MEAVGMLEVFGLATAFAAADAGCKAGNVRLENFDKILVDAPCSGEVDGLCKSGQLCCFFYICIRNLCIIQSNLVFYNLNGGI